MVEELKLKFCRDCLYCEEWERERWTVDRWRCTYGETKEPEYDLVTGKRVDKIDNCYANRRDEGRCGPDGRWWKLRE